MHKKTILIDLDGVLNEYKGDYDKNIIPPVKQGAENFLKNLYLNNYEIIIFTSRNMKETATWLINNKLDKYIFDITNNKKPAWLYIDDRSICFNGDYNKLTEDINSFKVWYKK